MGKFAAKLTLDVSEYGIILSQCGPSGCVRSILLVFRRKDLFGAKHDAGVRNFVLGVKRFYPPSLNVMQSCKIALNTARLPSRCRAMDEIWYYSLGKRTA